MTFWGWERGKENSSDHWLKNCIQVPVKDCPAVCPWYTKGNNKALKLDIFWQNCLWLPQKDVDCGVIASKWLIFSEEYSKEIMFKEMEMCCPDNSLGLQDRYGKASRPQLWQKTNIEAILEHLLSRPKSTDQSRGSDSWLWLLKLMGEIHSTRGKYSQGRAVWAVGRLINGQPHLFPCSQGRHFTNYCQLAGLVKLHRLLLSTSILSFSSIYLTGFC